jgi:hypothetical protein
VDGLLTNTTSVNSPNLQPIDPNATSIVDDLLTGAAVTSVSAPGLQSIGVSRDAMDMDKSPTGGVLRASGGINISNNISAETQVTRVAAVAVGSHPLPPPLLSNDIDVDSVPAFLRSHGKGNREVDIFGYLNKTKDPRFQQVLRHYICIETNDRSRLGGTLPTAQRPVEISQWSSRARPDALPNFTKAKRTFPDFVDSVFAWWGSIQPNWRSFERGKVSREVCGGWDVIYAPRINGLLNVVILVYWWVRVLEEQGPKDGVLRADYERFADDVAWVFSSLSN